MELRLLKENRAFASGCIYIAMGAVWILGSWVLSCLSSPPSMDELHPISGVLAGRVTPNGPRKDRIDRAYFLLLGENVSIAGKVANFNSNLDENVRLRLQQLEPGAKITVWFTTTSIENIARRVYATVWRIQGAEADLLTYEQAVEADRAGWRFGGYAGLVCIAIGSVGVFFGRRAVLAEQRKQA